MYGNLFDVNENGCSLWLLCSLADVCTAPQACNVATGKCVNPVRAGKDCTAAGISLNLAVATQESCTLVSFAAGTVVSEFCSVRDMLDGMGAVVTWAIGA